MAQCPQLIWSDEFEGNALDLTKWEPQLGDGCNINLCSWGNNELQYYRAENATVSDGSLKITAKRESFQGKNYTSARLRTKNKADFRYGRMEASIRLPYGQGLWPAFWMLPTNEVYGGWPQSGEIDIMELVGNEPDVIHGTIHYGNPWPNNQSRGESYQLHRGDFSDGFHEFAIEWEPNEIRWYVDGYRYATQRSNVFPYRWPFDRDFHFLLNVAVGGNWPGNPNGSTVFPQVMEVDYVRVYDTSRPAMEGNRTVSNRSQGEIYRVANVPSDAVLAWRVPADAVIVSGQGTGQITVDWGEISGMVEVDITSGCGIEQLSLDVLVEGPVVYDFSFENFDDPGQVTYVSSTGTFSDNAANPAPGGPNTSVLVGKYVRDGAERYDVLVYRTSAISNVIPFLEGERRFYLDVYTDAPPGTLVLLQLENSNRATSSNYPTGRHSRYQAFTSVQNQWETLVFELLDRPDGNASSFSVNQLVFLFASDSFTGHTYYWDNFDVYQQQDPTTSITTFLFETDTPFTLYPNPAEDTLIIQVERLLDIHMIQVRDISGKVVSTSKINGEFQKMELDIHNLVPGLYFLQMKDSSGKLYQSKFIKE